MLATKVKYALDGARIMPDQGCYGRIPDLLTLPCGEPSHSVSIVPVLVLKGKLSGVSDPFVSTPDIKSHRARTPKNHCRNDSPSSCKETTRRNNHEESKHKLREHSSARSSTMPKTLWTSCEKRRNESLLR